MTTLDAQNTETEKPYYYRVQKVSFLLGVSQRKVYDWINDPELKIEQKRLKSCLVKKATGTVPRSPRLITRAGFERLVQLIEEEKI